MGLCATPEKLLIIMGEQSGKLQVLDYQRKECVTVRKAQEEDAVVQSFFHPHLPFILTAFEGLSCGVLCRNDSVLVLPCKEKVCFITIEGECPKLDFEERGKMRVENVREECDLRLRFEKEYVAKIRQLEAELNTVSVERRALEEALQKETQTHTQRMKEVETELSNARMEGRAFRDSLERCQTEQERERGMHSKRVKQLQNEIGSLVFESAKLKERFERSKARVQHLECGLDNEGGALVRLETVRSALEEALQKERQTHTQRIKELETELSNVRTERQAETRALKERFETEKRMHAERIKELETALSDGRMERQALGERFQSFREFSLDELKSATNDFNDNCKLDQQNNYGCVYLGKITPVTVKRLEGGDSMTSQLWHVRLTREVVELLKSLRHSHLQTLLGVCYGGNCLVYEHMDNGNVKEWIASTKGPRRGFLPWYVRLRIMAQIAQAVSFLHSSKSLGGGPIIHRAIKPENILLGTNNLVAKLAEVDVALIASDTKDDNAAPGMTVPSS
ncbi:hypothetical protein CBR_g42104 [Chara braunii]|uniref:Protein kinase domain-containing protein n=1 Tax=Chara braunii TaxID=69332 RepID=A0A388LX31_CHABU|nr:hypothetical protein CBR_g42104 [Chara braunii]|eukprot:GBG86821.1 hypothetical protein CBR_g42104 [Chara braunii]